MPDTTFDEDRRRSRKDASPPNFAVIGHSGYNLLKALRILALSFAGSTAARRSAGRDFGALAGLRRGLSQVRRRADDILFQLDDQEERHSAGD